MNRAIGGIAAAIVFALPAVAQEVPNSVDAVAQPGGDLPGDPKIQLVKVADGFNDPVGVANAGDGSGRIFVVERVGRIRVVAKDGPRQEEPFLDLTTINPLGSDLQTGFVEQGLYSVAFHPVARYGGLDGVYLVGDWCSGRVFGLGWDGQSWQLEELMQTDLPFTSGGYDEDGNVLAVNCNCFYIGEQGPLANPPGALWRVMPVDQVPAGAEVARTVQ